MVLIGLLLGVAQAGPSTTRDSLDRLEEVLQIRIEEGKLAVADVMPAILVSTRPRYEESQEWFGTRAIEVIQKSFGNGGLRLCAACMAPRAFVAEGNMVYQTGPIGLDEVVRLDDQARGDAQPARTAIWLDEHRGGVSIRIIDLRTSRVVFAQNIDPTMVEVKNSGRMYSLAAEYERRARGGSLTQAFVDVALYPGQHVSFDWTDQWGKRNELFTGVTISLFDPVVGIGITAARRFKLLNIQIGAKVILSMPTAITRALADSNIDLLDPLLTGVAYGRLPMGRSNYGLFVSASTNGEFGVGLSLLNIQLLPVLP